MPTIKELIIVLRDPDESIRFKAMFELKKMAMEATAPGRQQQRVQIAQEIREEIFKTGPGKNIQNQEINDAPVYPLNVQREMLIRLMYHVAGEQDIPFLTEAMKNLEVREVARCVLDGISSPEATQALIAALDEVGLDFLIGVVNSLGRRSSIEALAALQEVTKDESYDPQVRVAAAEALANFPELGNDALITALTNCPCRQVQARANKARLRLAYTLKKAGKNGEARRIFQAIMTCKYADVPQKRAAEMALKE